MNSEVNFSFPLKNAFSKNEIEQGFWKCLYTATEEKMLHYSVILPKRLQPAEIVPAKFPEVRLTNIGRYFPVDDSPYLEVWAAYEHCEWEMNASDWLFNRLARMGENILHQRIIVNPAGSGSFADVLSLKTLPSGDDVISRYTVQKDYNPKQAGGNYILLKASCSSQDYEELANDIYLIVTNWDLINRSNLVTAEQLNTVHIDHQSSFKIPASWQAKTLGDNRLIAEHTINGVNHGVINYYYYPEGQYNSPNEVLVSSTERFGQAGSGITLTHSDLEIIPNELNEASGYVFYVSTGEVYSAKDKMRAFYMVVIFEQAGHWCYTELIGSHRSYQDYYYEANKRCLDLILSTTQLRMD